MYPAGGQKCSGGRWVYTMREGFTSAKTFKARYVAKGYGVDYQENFAE